MLSISFKSYATIIPYDNQHDIVRIWPYVRVNFELTNENYIGNTLTVGEVIGKENVQMDRRYMLKFTSID